MMILTAALALAAQGASGDDWIRDPAFEAANSAFLNCTERALAADAATRRSERRAVERAFDACAAEERALNAVGIRLRGADLGQHTGTAMRLIFRDLMTQRLRALRAAQATPAPAR